VLFKWGQFKSAAGLDLDWKVECDALDADDWRCIARACAGLVGPFGAVVGVPTGGLRLAKEMQRFISQQSSIVLVTDDVWTTGASMYRTVAELGLQPGQWKGLIAFSRSYRLPSEVFCFCEVKAP
jgi:hypothetical protein